MKLHNGIHLHVVSTSKFKDIGISVRFMNRLEEKQATLRSLLALMICDRCEKYPTKKMMSKRMDELYGAVFNAHTVGYGAAQVLDIRMKIIDPRYAPHSSLLEHAFDFLQETLLHPLFTEDTLTENKAILQAKMERMRDEPSQYAVSQGLKLAGEGLPLGISALGEIEHIKEITLDDVQKAHQRLFQEDRIDILVCGDVQESYLKELVKARFSSSKKDAAFKSYYAADMDRETKESIEYRHISQSSIMMTWFTDTSMNDKDYFALKIANAMFGQYPTSFLFQEVREKNSLCYSIYSNMISYDGALGVTTGVEKEHIQKAIDLIKQQFQKLCDGEFDDDLIDISKTMIVNSLLATKDSMQSLLALAYQNAILGEERTVDDLVNYMKEVTRQDIQRAAQKCRLVYTFVLTDKEDEHEEDRKF